MKKCILFVIFLFGGLTSYGDSSSGNSLICNIDFSGNSPNAVAQFERGEAIISYPEYSVELTRNGSNSRLTVQATNPDNSNSIEILKTAGEIARTYAIRYGFNYELNCIEPIDSNISKDTSRKTNYDDHFEIESPQVVQ